MPNNFFQFLTLIISLFSLLPARAQDFKSEVAVESLPELSANVLGTIPTKNPRLWSGTPADKLLETLEKTGKANLSPALRALVTYLLQLDITGAGFNDSQNILQSDQFFVARLKTLERQGEWDIVLNLIEKVPETEITNEIKQIKATVLLMKGLVKEACQLQEELAEAKNENGESVSNIEADKMLISCFLAKEEKDKAVLAYDLFQDAHPDADSDFTALADMTLRELPVELPENLVLSPSNVYLYASVKNPTLNIALQTREVKKILSDLPATDIILRIRLGEQIGLDLTELQRLYRLPLLNLPTDNAVAQRVQTYQQIQAETDASKKAALISKWLNLIQKDNLFVPLAPLIAETFHQLEADEKYIDLALYAVQAFALTKNPAAAEPWFELLEDNDLYQQHYLTASLLLQTLGSGPRDFQERLDYYCSYAKPIDCARLKRFLPEENDDEISSSEKEKTNLTTQLGESLLNAVLNIADGKDVKDSYTFIQKAARPVQGRALLREGIISQ